jgi:hypothetical protein
MFFSSIKGGFSRNSPHQALARTGGKADEIWLAGAAGSDNLVTKAMGGNLRQKPSSGPFGQKWVQALQAFMVCYTPGILGVAGICRSAV